MRIKASRASALPDNTREKTSTPQWYTHALNQSAFYRLIAAFSPYIPRPMRHALASPIAAALRPLMPREYAAVRANMRRIVPETDATGLERIVREVFTNFAYTFTDLLSLNRQTLSVQERYVHHVHGREHLQQCCLTPRGFIAATAHLGNWDLGGRLLQADTARTVYALVAPEQNATIQRLLRPRDQTGGVRFVTNDQTGTFMQLLMALRRGAIVAVQMDRGVGHRSDVPVTFFGTPVLFPSGPFILAAAAQVPVLPCFCLMRPDYHYEIFIDAPLLVQRGNETTALQQMAGILERYIAMAPTQWFNFYDVWSPAVV